MDYDKFYLLKQHGCADGLSDDAIREIAEACDLLRFESGEFPHRAHQTFKEVYLVIHGRIKVSILDIQGNVLVQRFPNAGALIGCLPAALGEPSPIELEAAEPSTLLRLNYQRLLELARKHAVFQQNIMRLTAESVQNVLLKNRRPKKRVIVAFFHQSPATRPLTLQLIKRLENLGESLAVLSDQEEGPPIAGIPWFCLSRNGVHVSADEIRQQSDLWLNSKRVIVDVDTGVDPTRALELVKVCDKIFWCVTPANWQESVARLKAFEQRAPGWKDKIRIVWILDDGSQWAPSAPALNELADRNYRLSFNQPESNRNRGLIDGIERIVHELRGIRIGVALGGGAARGMAHLGVLKVLEENGIVVDMIAGTSVGAMTGVLYASGMEPDYNVACFVKDLRPSWLFRHMPNGGYWYLLYKYRTGQFDPMLRNYLKDSRLEQLPIPVLSITVDLISGQAVVRDQGDSVHAITESINLPVLSTPINRDGRALVDGGIVNNVPADVLVARGCNFVIAVSVTSQIKQEFARNQPETPTEKMRRASALNTIMRTYLVQNVNMNSVGVQPADLVIHPDVTEFDITEFTRAGEMAEIGKQTALQALPQIKRLLAQVDDRLFAENQASD